jgi:uncharacterized membrane protein YjjP (DUF1212 family)
MENMSDVKAVSVSDANSTGQSDIDHYLLVDAAVLAGELMLTSGAETYRVEDTISRILRTSEFERCDVFVVTTGITVTLADWRVGKNISMVRRIGDKEINLGRIHFVNEVSREYCNGSISLKEAFHRLRHIQKRKAVYPQYLINICTLAASGFFTLLLGGLWLDGLLAAFNGLFLVAALYLSGKRKINIFVVNMVFAFFISFATLFVHSLWLPQINIDLVIAGSVMVLLPGVAITNAIRDTLAGDYMSGAARAIEAFVIAMTVGVGMGTGLMLCDAVVGGLVVK